MFSLPTQWGQTPEARNEQRNEQIAERLDGMAKTLRLMSETVAGMSRQVKGEEEGWGGTEVDTSLAYGRGHYMGRTLNEALREVRYLIETTTEITLVAGRYEVTGKWAE